MQARRVAYGGREAATNLLQVNLILSDVYLLLSFDQFLSYFFENWGTLIHLTNTLTAAIDFLLFQSRSKGEKVTFDRVE